MSKIHVFDHPLVRHKLNCIRGKDTGTGEFRGLVDEVGMLMAYKVTRDLQLQDVEIEAPATTTTVKRLAGKKLAIVPVLRAGLGMTDGVLNLVPTVRVGHIGSYRDSKALRAVEYLAELPQDIDGHEVIVIDPVLATGTSTIETINSLKGRGAENIRFMCLIAAPEDVEKIQEAHKDVDVYTAALDEKLSGRAYAMPGLGNAGDRLFGTK